MWPPQEDHIAWAENRTRSSFATAKATLGLTFDSQAARALTDNRVMAVGRSLAHPVRYAVLAAGGLPVLVFPAPNLEFLAWFALVPGLLAMHRSPSARGLAVWGLLRPPVSAGRALAAVVVVPCVWLVIDLIRSWQALGGPWALYGASQWRHPVMLALAAVGGVWLITAVLVAANTAILVALVSARPATRVTGVAAAAALLAAGPLAYTLATPAAPARPARPVRVALVQPGIVAGPRIRVNASQRLTTTLTTARAARPDLIVWGESSVAYNLHTHPWQLSQLRALSARMGAEILVNQDAPHGQGHISKVATLVSPAGIQARLRATTPAGRALPIGVLICFESAFPDMSRVAADKGAQLIVYQSATSTFQDSWAPAQHASLGALRAAETGRPVVQAALTGVSAAFDGRGRNLAWFATARHGVITARLALPSASARTPYDRLGEYVPYTAAAVSAIAALYGLIRLRRARRRPPARSGHAPIVIS